MLLGFGSNELSIKQKRHMPYFFFLKIGPLKPSMAALLTQDRLNYSE